MNAQELIIYIGRVAERRFGLTAGEHPRFGGVEPVHAENSWHYEGLAVDVTGPANRLAAFNRWVAENYGDTIGELFYDPGINIDKGTLTEAIGGHGSHVHVATDPALEPDRGYGGGPLGFAKEFILGDPLEALNIGSGDDLKDKIKGVAADALPTAADVGEWLIEKAGGNAAAIALNVALVGGGAGLVYYGIAKMAGVDEPVITLASRTPAGAAVGAAT